MHCKVFQRNQSLKATLVSISWIQIFLKSMVAEFVLNLKEKNEFYKNEYSMNSISRLLLPVNRINPTHLLVKVLGILWFSLYKLYFIERWRVIIHTINTSWTTIAGSLQYVIGAKSNTILEAQICVKVSQRFMRFKRFSQFTIKSLFETRIW